MNKRLILLRKKMSYKQKEFAEILGVTQAFLSEIEKEKKNVSLNIVVKLYSLGVNLNWLIGGEGEMFRTSNFVPSSDSLLSELLLIFKQLPDERKKLVLDYAIDQKTLSDLLKNNPK
ncbi:helix-turn-helix transcriptional regulator [bacterium]|nr:helix-turn-helix transcriptional regulator [bacterium]